MSKSHLIPGPRNAAQAAAFKYEAAFLKAYPQKTVDVRPVRNASGDYAFRVVINGSPGDRALTWDELKDAIAAFLR